MSQLVTEVPVLKLALLVLGPVVGGGGLLPSLTVPRKKVSSSHSCLELPMSHLLENSTIMVHPAVGYFYYPLELAQG